LKPGDTVSQWWSWQQPTTTPTSTLKRESRPAKPSVIRSGSLKEEMRPEPERQSPDDDEEDGFVRANPVRGQHVTVKSAIIRDQCYKTFFCVVVPLKNLGMEKHASLLCGSFGDEEKKFFVRLNETCCVVRP
jgi:hypothetical protein